MDVIDISVAVGASTVVYPGDPVVRLERFAALADGDVANVSKLDFGVHTGTHVDAPVHFFDGAAGADALPVDALVGPAVVVDVHDAVEAIDAAAVDALALPPGVERVLLRSRNGWLWERAEYSDDYVSLVESGARALVERGVRLIGIEYLSIGDLDAHRALLEAGVVPLEGLDLRHVEPGEYLLVAAPLKLVGADGAPARAFLLRDD